MREGKADCPGLDSYEMGADPGDANSLIAWSLRSAKQIMNKSASNYPPQILRTFTPMTPHD